MYLTWNAQHNLFIVANDVKKTSDFALFSVCKLFSDFMLVSRRENSNANKTFVNANRKNINFLLI